MEAGIKGTRSQQEERHEPFSREALLQELPWMVRRYVKWFPCLLNSNQKRTAISKWISMFLCFFMGTSYGLFYFEYKDGEYVYNGIQTLMLFIGLAQTVATYYLYEFFKDGGFLFYKMHLLVSKKHKRISTRIFNVVVFVLHVGASLTSLVVLPFILARVRNDNNAPGGFLAYTLFRTFTWIYMAFIGMYKIFYIPYFPNKKNKNSNINKHMNRGLASNYVYDLCYNIVLLFCFGTY